MSTTTRYCAFISYSRADEALATRLHNQLERYRVAGARRRALPQGAGGRFRPVFRDNSELPATKDLGGALRSALDVSQALIVIVSEFSIASRWVAEEVRHFTSLPEARPVIAIVAPANAESGAALEAWIKERAPQAQLYHHRAKQKRDAGALDLIVGNALRVMPKQMRKERERHALLLASPFLLVFVAVTLTALDLFKRADSAYQGARPSEITAICAQASEIAHYAARLAPGATDAQQRAALGDLRFKASLVAATCLQTDFGGRVNSAWLEPTAKPVLQSEAERRAIVACGFAARHSDLYIDADACETAANAPGVSPWTKARGLSAATDLRAFETFEAQEKAQRDAEELAAAGWGMIAADEAIEGEIPQLDYPQEVHETCANAADQDECLSRTHHDIMTMCGFAWGSNLCSAVAEATVACRNEPDPAECRMRLLNKEVEP